eukprot:scaffold136369_cov44-Prasinocladus_malaysianus.AAC.1
MNLAIEYTVVSRGTRVSSQMSCCDARDAILYVNGGMLELILHSPFLPAGSVYWSIYRNQGKVLWACWLNNNSMRIEVLLAPTQREVDKQSADKGAYRTA